MQIIDPMCHMSIDDAHIDQSTYLCTQIGRRKMLGKIGRLFLFVLCAVWVSNSYAQDNDAIGTLYLSGKVVNENKRGLKSTIYVYKGTELIKEFPTTKIGKFNLDVVMQDSITLVIYEAEHVSKTILGSTKIHPAKQKKDHMFPFFIDLYPVGRIPSHIDLDRPVGKIIYAGGQFVYDVGVTKAANDELKEYIKERRQMKVRNEKK
jgi:hypothetical protein